MTTPILPLTPLSDQDEEFGFSQPDDIKRRRRTTPEELSVLEAEYAKNTLPDAKNRVRIGQMTNMSARSVQIWFQNKRQTDKRKAQGLTRRPPRRIPVGSFSHPHSILSLTRDSLGEDEQQRKKRKTLEQAASEAQRRGPTSPSLPGLGLPRNGEEFSAALAIARMQSHSVPFPPRRPLGQLDTNALRPGLSRYASSTLPPSFSRTPEPQAFVRAYSLPSAHFPTAHGQGTKQDPIWERMLSSPQSSPYVAPFGRKRPFEHTPGSHSVPFGARREQESLPEDVTDTSDTSDVEDVGSPLPLEASQGSTSSRQSFATSISDSGCSDIDPDEQTERYRYSQVKYHEPEEAEQPVEAEAEEESIANILDVPDAAGIPDLSFDSVSSQSSDPDLTTSSIDSLPLLLKPHTSGSQEVRLLVSREGEGGPVRLSIRIPGDDWSTAGERHNNRPGGKEEGKEKEKVNAWEKEAAELLCFMASGRGEGR
ncbi:homeobox-domain-containing protein [Dacryopinax primogenitus]|uniref:Homeobox-domain-containing protein n=1 Tax=Dacryopinax primogenitus (strain DJM 731) TaxID=1858805 RepID=M5G6V7_DACPD|nr:homeobox-domain-containing protein [Dacryopinax primogenitus]EJU01552.1 homeobox-domain-containing protein [Dacryopinax primogenitus]